MDPQQTQHEQVMKLLRENERLTFENNVLLKKITRSATIASLFRTVWFVIVIATPFLMYYLYLQQSIEDVRYQFDRLDQVTEEIENIKNLYQSLISLPAEAGGLNQSVNIVEREDVVTEVKPVSEATATEVTQQEVTQ